MPCLVRFNGTDCLHLVRESPIFREPFVSKIVRFESTRRAWSRVWIEMWSTWLAATIEDGKWWWRSTAELEWIPLVRLIPVDDHIRKEARGR